MPARFHRHDTLRLFIEIAQHSSLSAAATALNMTKGAVSYQIKALEEELDLSLFTRQPRGIALTPQGEELLAACRPPFEALEAAVTRLKGEADRTLTVGLSSYLAARWLSPRLMRFMQRHPDIRLRLQPMIQLFDLERQGVDIALRWGNGNWDDVEVEPFLPMPSWPAGNRAAFERVQEAGLDAAFASFTLLRDHDGSNAWSDWTARAGLAPQQRRETLIIPDPNVRVQAIIDGQGIALMDDLVADEMQKGQIFRLSDVALSDYGYFLARPRTSQPGVAIDHFVNWLKALG